MIKMGNKTTRMKWLGKTVWITARGSYFVIVNGTKKYLPSAFRKGKALARKRR
jgi:hypothetical protein